MKRVLSKLAFLLALAMACGWLSNAARAGEDDDHDGHPDIILGYNNLVTPSFIEIEGTPLSANGFLLFEADFGQFFSTIDPGFSTEPADGLEITPGHSLFLQTINASSAVQGGQLLGFVNFFDDETGQITAWGQITITGEGGSSWQLNGSSAVGGPVLIQVADDVEGGIHDHVAFDLLGDTDKVGAYGVLFSLFTHDANGNFVAASDNFWIVFNNGMDDAEFESRAVAAFGNFSAVPEPGSGLLLCGVALAAFAGRRRRG
jgi:hypothetical protein